LTVLIEKLLTALIEKLLADYLTKQGYLKERK
jgi:hypothetical protein